MPQIETEEKRLLEGINRLQELCVEIPNSINLPQIAVVGAQSSGKSSILENIAGYDFLPRGPGMVTRRPLLVQILTGSPEEFVIFGHAPGKKYLDMEAVREEITNETNRLLGGKNDVSAVPIILKIHKKRALPLTLIDLPGIVKLRANEQPEEIVQKIQEIVRSYITHKNTVILAVTPSTTDLPSSDALMAAKEVDPNFERTLCLLTKVDLMDPGTDLLKILTGSVVGVKLGFIPVICRGEKALKNKVSIEKALQEEEDYFKSSQPYSDISRFCGAKYLTRRLHEILGTWMKKTAPFLQERIGALLEHKKKEMLELGEEVRDKKKKLIDLIGEFKEEVEQKLCGTYRLHSLDLTQKDIAPTQLEHGAKISDGLDAVFANSILKAADMNLSDEEIKAVILNSSGVFGAPQSAASITHFVSKAAALMLPECLAASTRALFELQVITDSSLNQVRILRFPRLKCRMAQAVNALLQKNHGAADSSIQRFLKWNTVYIRSSRNCRLQEALRAEECTSSKAASPAHCSASGSYAADQKNTHNPNREPIMEHINKLRNTVIDQVPKIIVHDLIYRSLSEIRGALISALYVPEDIEQMLQEDPESLDRRERLRKSCAALEEAHTIAGTL